MDKIHCGVQLYTLRKHLTNENDVRKTFIRLSKMGVDLVQISAMCKLPAKTIKQICDDTGIKICVTHDSFDDLKNNLDKVAEDHLYYGCDTVGLGCMPREFRADNYKKLPEFVDFASDTVQKLAKYNLDFSYHNHNFEFEKVNGKKVFDILIEDIDKKMQFLLDTFWVRYAGESNEEYMARLNGRIKNIHLKDYKPKKFILPARMIELGKGTLDFPKLLEIAKQNGTVNALYEQDICKNDWKSTEISWEYLKKEYILK